MQYKIVNQDDDYEYAKDYTDLDEAIAEITEYEKEDLKSEKGEIKWYVVNDDKGNEVFNSLDMADKLLGKMIKNKTI